MKIIGVELKATDLGKPGGPAAYDPTELAVFGTQIEMPDDRDIMFAVTLHTSNGDINIMPTRATIPPAPSRGSLRELAARVWKSWN